jgi:hypothetical protein
LSEGVSAARCPRNIQPGASTAATVLPGLSARTIAATISGNPLADVWLLPMKRRLISAAGGSGDAEAGEEPPPPHAVSRAARTTKTPDATQLIDAL